jgi:uncharacterized protein YprB with RNaseH-like and TPR domain
LIGPDSWYCIHGHTGTEHRKCYERYIKNAGGRIGYLDIETSNLDADFGVMLSWAIKTKGKNEILTDRLTRKDVLSLKYDKDLVGSLIVAMKSYDIIYTFYGARFDIPFSRSRALFHGLMFPTFHQIRHIDLWFAARSKLKIHSNRLQTVCEFLGIKGKTPILGKYWVEAMSGNDTALHYIQRHNIADAVILEKAAGKLEPYMAISRTSI